MGHKIFNLELISAAESYLRQLTYLVRLELETVARTKRVHRRDAFGNTSYSIDEIIDEALTSNFRHDRLNSLTNFGLIAASKRMDSLVSSILYLFREILETVIALDDRITRRSTTYSIMECISKIHHKSADVEIHNNFWTTGWLCEYIDKMRKKYPDDSKNLTQKFCQMSLYSIKKGYYWEIDELGMHVSRLIDDYPDLTVIILDTLRKSIEIVNKLEDIEMRKEQTEKILEKVKSAKKWNKFNHVQVTRKIEEILNEYSFTS